MRGYKGNRLYANKSFKNKGIHSRARNAYARRHKRLVRNAYKNSRGRRTGSRFD